MKKVDNMRNYFIAFFGIRTVKTALAISISMWISSVFDLKMPSMVALSVITSMSSSIFDSYKDSLDRFYSTIVGVIVGIFFHFIGFTNYFAMALAAIIVINICNFFKWQSATKLALMIVVVVMLHRPSPPIYLSYWEYSFNRIIDTVVGLGVGFLINFIVLPPDRMRFIINTYKKTLEDMEKTLIDFLQGENVELSPLIADVNKLSVEVGTAEKEYIFGGQTKIKSSDLANINSLYFSAFGIMSKFIEDEQIPTMTDDNIKNLQAYYKQNFIIDFDKKLDDDFEMAFNYYFDDLLVKLNQIRAAIEKIEKEHQEDPDS